LVCLTSGIARNLLLRVLPPSRHCPIRPCRPRSRVLPRAQAAAASLCSSAGPFSTVREQRGGGVGEAQHDRRRRAKEEALLRRLAAAEEDEGGAAGARVRRRRRRGRSRPRQRRRPVGWARHLPAPASALLLFPNERDSNAAGKGAAGPSRRRRRPHTRRHWNLIDPPEGSTDTPLEDTNRPTEHCIRPRTCRRRRSPPPAQCARFPAEMSCRLPPSWCRASGGATRFPGAACGDDASCCKLDYWSCSK
jgi:hypothetical protein